VSKIISYASLGAPQPDDVLVIVDVHDTTMSAQGTTKQATVSAVAGAPVPVTVNASASGTVNLDPLAQELSVTMTGNCTFTFTPGSSLTSGDSYTFSVYLYQDGTGSRTTTWPGSVSWLGGNAPSLPLAAGTVTLLTFESFNAGTTWYGSAVQELPPLPLSVANGGTGDSSLTSYALITGGTTSTGPAQSLASAGSQGQFLVSQGSGALPAWQYIPVRTVTSSYPVTVADGTILLNAATLTATLPAAGVAPGIIYTVKLIASGTTGTVATTSAQTIDGSTTYSLSAQYKYVTVQSDGSNWQITGNN
jgi:hypothetical protein